ncbi:CheR family methyltransferase [Anaeromicrobium sediminis]|nr:protein-glutamate O-methyltransferase CheR [Anaeromicrobium sediminis]
MNYEEFKDVIHRKSKINLNYYKERQMKRRIDSLIKRNNFKGYKDYYEALCKDKDLYEQFINYLTINVSEFYRNINQWKVLESEVFPYLLSKNKKLKIWSAACSTGDEPYSLAMCLSNLIPLSSISIIATDIDKEVLRKAKEGIYSEKSVAGVPTNFVNKYFNKVGDKYQIKSEIKKCIEFKEHNLLNDPYPKNCDLIVCRNVMIYFTEESKDMIYKKFNESLKGGGILFVGSTEQIIMPTRYNFESLKTFFYKKI